MNESSTTRIARAKDNRDRARHWLTVALRRYEDACHGGQRGEADRMHRAYVAMATAVEFATLACDELIGDAE